MICRSDHCKPGNLLTAGTLQGVEVNIKRPLGVRKSSSVFATIARTTAIESIQRRSRITLQSKYNCPNIAVVN